MFNNKARKMREQLANQNLFNDDTKQAEATEAEDAMEAADIKAGLKTGGLTLKKAAENIYRNMHYGSTAQDLSSVALPDEATNVIETILEFPKNAKYDDVFLRRIDERNRGVW